MKRIVLILFCSMMSVTANAQFMNGNKLYEDFKSCETKQTQHSCSYALGYVTGVYDALKDSLMGRDFCAPSGITQGQLGDLVHLYLKENPGKMSYSAHTIIWTAVTKAWPCPED